MQNQAMALHEAYILGRAVQETQQITFQMERGETM
uniref:Uncharacterized protein n=1 Tax=Arundo donax TaxID=35708 RepID=A0A0A8YAZ7_ARUDO